MCSHKFSKCLVNVFIYKTKTYQLIINTHSWKFLNGLGSHNKYTTQVKPCKKKQTFLRGSSCFEVTTSSQHKNINLWSTKTNLTIFGLGHLQKFLSLPSNYSNLGLYVRKSVWNICQTEINLISNYPNKTLKIHLQTT